MPASPRLRPILAVALAFCAAVFPLKVSAQQARRPLTKDNVVRLLKGDVAPHRVGEMTQERGIDFEVTPEVEGELRRAGATDELLSTLRQLAATRGTVLENARDGLKYVRVLPGTFTMGCSPGDNRCSDAEKPAHQVTITKGFWLGQTPVTAGAYKRFASETGRAMPPEPKLGNNALNPGWRNEQMPIVNVTWDDSQAYCHWAGGRLPTEAEWEYAARAGSAEARYGPLDEVAWYADNSGRERIDSARIWLQDHPHYGYWLAGNGNTMHVVGLKQPNDWRLYDMLGNIWEWVNDWYGERYYQSRPESDPQGPDYGNLRLLRGGSWDQNPSVIRVSFRGPVSPGARYISYGCRCLRPVDIP